MSYIMLAGEMVPLCADEAYYSNIESIARHFSSMQQVPLLSMKLR